MTRHPALRISVVAAVVALVVLLCLGGYNQRRLEELRAVQRKLVGQAAANGIFLDPSRPASAPRITKRPRLDPVAHAKRISAEFVVHASKAYRLGESSDPADRQRMMEQMDQVLALNGDQLKVFIGEILASAVRLHEAGDTASSYKFICDHLLNFALGRLAQDHPHDALEWIAGSPDLMQVVLATRSSLTNNGVSSALGGWADSDPAAATDWFRENGDRLGVLKEAARVSLVLSACVSDPQLAIQILRESGDASETWVHSLTSGYEGGPPEAKTPQRLSAVLTLLHTWRSNMADDEPARQEFDESIRRLTFGIPRRESFESVTGWIDGARLSPRELGSITQQLEDRVNVSETGRWIDWLGQNLPTDPAGGSIGPLMERWTQADHQAAAEWLATAPDGAAKHASIRAYAETLSKYEPETAAEWAATLPAGKERDETHQRIYRNWPREEARSRQAAETFAENHGLK